MGSSYSISCEECDYTKTFLIGIGMGYSPSSLLDFDSEFALLPRIIKSKKALSHIKLLLNEKDAVIADGYGHEVYRCAKCNEFYDRFFIHLDYDSGEYEVDYKCTKCKSVLERINCDPEAEDGFEDEKNVLEKNPCPKCGNYSLYEGGLTIIMWD